MFNWFKRKPTATIQAQPIVINPHSAAEHQFAAYRTDAIAREIEQRKAEKRERHPDHDAIVSEAKMYGHMLAAKGLITGDELAKLFSRLN
jgi:hypothetical protein